MEQLLSGILVVTLLQEKSLQEGGELLLPRSDPHHVSSQHRPELVTWLPPTTQTLCGKLSFTVRPKTARSQKAEGTELCPHRSTSWDTVQGRVDVEGPTEDTQHVTSTTAPLQPSPPAHVTSLATVQTGTLDSFRATAPNASSAHLQSP